jgi:hypothetical protein
MANFFYKAVNKRSRQDLVNFLQEHERYHVMNSWNGVWTFANKVKVHYMSLPKELLDRAFELVCCDGPFRYRWERQLSSRLSQFEQEQGGYYKMGFNGRSGGYLILVGKDFATLNQDPGEYEDRYSWTMSCLQSRVGLVQDFDRMCDIIREDFIYYCQGKSMPLLRRVI